MATYKITVKKVYEREIEIAADCISDATEKVLEMYNNGEIVLDENNYDFYDFDIDDAEWWKR